MCQHLPKEKRTPKKINKTPKIPTDPDDRDAPPKKSFKRGKSRNFKSL